MPAIDAVLSPPASVVAKLGSLRDGLDAALPARGPGELLLGTWNVRAFAGLTPKWTTGPHDSPKRNLADICAIAEIVSRFDVVAIQETRDDLTALRTLMLRLGPDWAFLSTDTVEGDAGNGERLAYIYDRTKLRLSGLAGELVIDEAQFGTASVPLRHQFARTPFMVSFATLDGAIAFTLLTLHVDYGADAAQRTPEIVTFAHELKRRAMDADEFSRNLIALGDFNIDRIDDANAQAFIATGLTPPLELLDLPRTIFDKPHAPHYYDQIAWFTDGDHEALTLHYTKQAGYVDWTGHLLGDLTNTAKSWRISDHYPLWAQFAAA